MLHWPSGRRFEARFKTRMGQLSSDRSRDRGTTRRECARRSRAKPYCGIIGPGGLPRTPDIFRITRIDALFLFLMLAHVIHRLG